GESATSAVASLPGRCYVRRRGPGYCRGRAGIADEGGNVAEAIVEQRQLLKTLHWYDGFVICLANPGFLLGSLDFSVLDLGGWGAAVVWGITAAIVFPVTIIYSELVAMCPLKSGGVSVYAN